MLDVTLADDELAWSLGSDGAWSKVTGDAGVSTQRRLRDLALSHAAATP